jgi:hypothetical protein
MTKTIAMNRKVQAPKGQVFELGLEEYVNVTKSAEVTSLINQIRQTEDKDERRRLKGMLPFRCPHYFRFAGDHRAQDSILPEEFTFQTCVDIDDASQVAHALALAYHINTIEGEWKGLLLHAEYSASKKLHLDIRIPVGMTIEEAQRAYTKALGVDFDSDCCSPERMIYITDSDSQLYTSEDWQTRLSDDEIAERREAYAKRGLDIDGRELKIKPTSECDLKDKPSRDDTDDDDTDDSGAIYSDEYRGIPYTMIVEELADQLGGAPEHGNRNDFIFAMSCHLRHVCNDDPQWIRTILPDYGEQHERVTETIQNACKRKQVATMSQKMKLTLDLCRRRLNMENGDSHLALLKEPQMPKRLPAPIRIAISKVPEHCRAAMANAIFPAWATRMGGVKLEYADNSEMEATIMNVLVAPMSTGKSCIKRPIDISLKDIVARDTLCREQEQQWKDEQNNKQANKKGTARPTDICIQVNDSDMTNAAFTQRLADAERAGHKCLYTRMDEVEMLSKMAGGSSKEMVSRIICRNFDTDMYGQERVGAQSVTARAPMRWCWNASTTPAAAIRFFRKNVNDGTVSRLNFCTIQEIDDNGEIPVYKRYDKKFEKQLTAYQKLLDDEASNQGVIVCPQAKKMAGELCRMGVERAALIDHDGYRILARRAAVIAFRKACILFIMNGKKWSRDIEDFCRWSFDYDMWVKMSLYSESLSEDMEMEKRMAHGGMSNNLDLLPDEFTREECRSMRIQQGKKNPNPKDQLGKWTQRGFIIYDEVGKKYHKTLKYLSGHAA